MARLALHWHALAERMQTRPATTLAADAARDDRVRRLRDAVEAAGRAMVAAAGSGVDAPATSAVAARHRVDRRGGDRRVSGTGRRRPGGTSSTQRSGGAVRDPRSA